MLTPADISIQAYTTLTGHRGAVYALAAGFGEEDFFSAGGDGIIAHWKTPDAPDAEAIAVLDTHIFSLYSLNKTEQLLVGDMSGMMRLMDIKTRTESHQTAFDGHAVYALEGGPDESVLVGLANGYLVHFNPHTWEPIQRKRIAEKNIRCLVRYDNLLFAGSSDGNIYMLQLPGLELIDTIKGHTGAVFSLAFHREQQYLISGSMDATLRVTPLLAATAGEPLAAHLYTINDITIHPSGNYFATASRDKSIRIWDATSFHLLASVKKDSHNGHAHSVNKLFWSKSGRHLISCSDDRTIKVWQIQLNK